MADEEKTPRPRLPVGPKPGERKRAHPLVDDPDWESAVEAWDASFDPTAAPTARPTGGPSAEPGFYSEEEGVEPTVVSPPGSEPAGTLPPEQDSSSVLIIPDVESLSAPTTSGPTTEPAMPPWAATPPAKSEGAAPDTVLADRTPTSPGRSLSEDGLPDLSGVYADPTQGAEPVTRTWETSRTVGGGVFEERLPEEDEAGGPLVLSFPSQPLPWWPKAVAEGLPQKASDPVDLGAGLRSLMHLLGGERGPFAPEQAVPPRTAAGKTAAYARVMETLGDPEVLAVYEEALALDPDCVLALRGRFRIRARAGSWPEALGGLEDLVRVLPAEAEAYRTLDLLARGSRAVGVEDAPGGGAPPAPAPASPPALGARLLAVERAIREHRLGSAALLTEWLAEALGGAAAETLGTLAGVLFEQAGAGATGAAARARLAPQGLWPRAFAQIRAAARHAVPANGASDAALPGAVSAGLEAAAEALAGTPLGPPLLRWAARAAFGEGQIERRHFLLEKLLADAKARPSLFDRLEVLANLPKDASPADALARLGGVPPPLYWPCVSAWVRTRLAQGSPSTALELLSLAKAEGPELGAEVLPVLAEQIAAESPDPGLRLEIWRRLGVWDGGRRIFAELAAAHLLLRAPESRADGARALEEVLGRKALGSGDASFWLLSWQFRALGQPGRAASALGLGAETFAGKAESIARILRDRATELDISADPGALVARLPGHLFHEERADDPIKLARALLSPTAEAGALAEAFKHAATDGSRARAFEAADWLLQSGAPERALDWVLDVSSPEGGDPLAVLWLRRLARQSGDAKRRASALGDLAPLLTDPVLRAGAELARGEALETAGRRREAAAVYRELLAGPHAKEADLALRRVLWADHDRRTLEAFWRDEHDAQFGAGRGQKAALALVEKARVGRDLGGDEATARTDLRGAVALDPESAEAHVALLTSSHLTPSERINHLEYLAGRMDAKARSLLFLGALLADGSDPGAGEVAGGLLEPQATSQRLLRLALGASDEVLPLALARRHVTVEENRKLPDPDLPGLLEARAAAIAVMPGADPRLATALYVRAAELEEAAGQTARAEVLLDRALAVEPDCLPALARRQRLLLSRGAHAQALDGAVALAAVLRSPTRKEEILLSGAELALGPLGDANRAQRLLEEILSFHPESARAFERLRSLLGAKGDHLALARLLGARAEFAPVEQIPELRFDRARLLLDVLGEREAGKKELTELVQIVPAFTDALARLAELEIEDGNPAAAAELSIRQARYEREPAALVACFLRIARLHEGPLKDSKVALGAYERVLRVQASNREALTGLSELYARHGELPKAVAVTERLTELESDPEKRRPFLFKLAGLWEASGDMRRAGVILRRIVEESPRTLEAIQELARFHERHHETAARNALLDGTVSLLSGDLLAGPDPLEALRALVPALRWRNRRACAVSAAQLLSRFSPDEAERNKYRGFASVPERGRRLAPLLNPELDQRALPAAVAGTIRHVLRQIGPALCRADRTDTKRWQPGRSGKQGRGSDLRRLFEPIAVDLGVKAFDLYVTPAYRDAMAIESGDTPAIIIGEALVSRGPAAMRFAAGYTLRLIATHFDVLLHHGAQDGAALLAAVVRRFVPDYHPAFLTAELEERVEDRFGRAISRSVRDDLAPFATELAGPLDPVALQAALEDVGARVGLLASGDLATGLEVLVAATSRPANTLEALLRVPMGAALVEFALSEDHEELAQALEAVA